MTDEDINQAERNIRQAWIERQEARWEKPLGPLEIEPVTIPEDELPY